MPIMKSMFQRRHYDFLVHWASIHIQPVEVASLADVLAVDNPRFDRKRFLKTYVELRRFARDREVAIEAQLEEGREIAAKLITGMPLKPSPSLTERNEDILGPKHGEAHSPHSSLVPAPDMGAYLRKHAEANRGRGMWEYTRCWKCANGTLPDLCPVGCRGACEYPSAIND
jgi:hypothetical protein